MPEMSQFHPLPTLKPTPNRHLFSDEAKSYNLRVYHLPDGRLAATLDVARLSAVSDRLLTEEEALEFLLQTTLHTLATIAESICAQAVQLRSHAARKEANGERAQANS